MKRFLVSVLALLTAGMSQATQRLTFITPSIVRVEWINSGVFSGNGNATGCCIYSPQDVKIDISEQDGKRIYRSSDLIVEADSSNDALKFIDPSSGEILLAENPADSKKEETVVTTRTIYDNATARMEETANGKITVKDAISTDTTGRNRRFTVNFLFSPDEALYGLGSHMEDYMNLLGHTVYLIQHNLKIAMPVLNSTKGYGLFFDVGCAMKFSSSHNADGNDYSGTMEMEAADQLDYYFIKGGDMNGVVGGYRYLTGDVSLMPKYVFGYIQSRERFTSSDEIISTLKEYRRRHVPIDMIVQDWNYWPEGWGYLKMDRRYYPDPKALADSVHSLNAKLMISIWPNPQYCPQEKDFRDHGYMLEHSVYDAFNEDARKHYWDYADREFFSNGFDAWWCDSSEPLDEDWNTLPESENGEPYGWNSHERRYNLSKNILGETLGDSRANLYALYHAKGIYENQRNATSDKRVVNLTRSAYAGQQRYGTIVWNGDTHASWESFRQQIPAGLNYMATGNPYWTIDVGSFFTRNDPRWFLKGEFPEGTKDEKYREYYTRMLQWATFMPVLRSHGTDTRRDIWEFGEPGTPYYDAILDMIRLRYALNPYIYSLAARQSFSNYTMARPLAFDFPGDKRVFDIKNEYMFGDFLVCPVTEPSAAAMTVYLPDDGRGGIWYDYWSGQKYGGGSEVTVDTPINRLPLFVRGGSIIPFVEPGEYAAATAASPLTFCVWPGNDASFELYDDNGDGYNFEKGEYSVVSYKWDDRERTLRQTEQTGNYVSPRPLKPIEVKIMGK